MWLLWTALVALVVLIVLGYLEKKYKRCGVYTQPGICYGLKRLLAWAHFKFVRLRRVPRVHNYDNSKADYVNATLVPCPEDEEAEQLRPLNAPEAHDGVTFFGSDCDGRQLLVRLLRRTGRQAELLLLLQTDGQLYQLPGMPDTTVYNTGSGWRAEGLAMECVLPMRVWRIRYRGQLRRCSNREEAAEGDVGGATCASGELVPAQLSLLWQPLSAPCDLRDCDTDLMARAVASELWTPEFLSLMGSFSLDGYLQFGCLRGELSVAGASPVEVFLRGPRQHRWADAAGPQAAPKHRSLRLQARFTDGSQLLLAADSWRGGITHLVYGVYMSAALKMSPVTSCNISLPDLAEEGHIPNVFNVIFSDGQEQHAVSCITTGAAMPSYSERPWRWINKLQTATTCLDGVDGTAIIEFGYQYTGPCPLRPEISLPLLVSSAAAVQPARVVTFTDPACRSEALVGGKAASLALLTELDLAEVAVPPGVVVTAEGYRYQLRRHPSVRRMTEEVVRVAAGVQEGDLNQACDRVVEEIRKTPVNKDIIDEVETLLQKEFGEDWPDIRFAVRSSALGEDGEELSAAGQNASVLGCRGRDQLRAGLAECWASLFAPHSVQYRRQHGQHVHPGMAVIVQRMVAAEVSGVMFTRDPVTGDPSQLSITASYGLGESVVSAKVDPDTITLSRSHTDQLAVIGRHLGSKRTQTVMAESGGTEEVAMGAGAAAAGCLPDAAALRLARVGLHLEKAFGGPRDIEWALSEDRIYLLQSRPVTSFAGWSELELTHEQDAALLTDHECLTNANTGEVLPNAISPLSLDTVCRFMAIVSDKLRAYLVGSGNPCPPYAGQYFPVTHCRYMIDITRTFLSSLQSWEEDDVEKATLMTVFGHLVDIKEAREIAIRRYGILSEPVKIYQQIAVARLAWRCGALVSRAQSRCGRFTLDTDSQRSSSAQQLYRYICSQLSHMVQITEDHVFCTTAGNALQVILLIILADGGQNAWDQDMFSSFAVLLSTCTGAESAEVPASLKRLSRLIAAADDAVEFVSAPLDDALNWLKTRHRVVAVSFEDFLATHGHRGVTEMDLLSLSWEMDPRPLVATLQTMVKNAETLVDTKTETDITQALDQLKVSLSNRSRKALSYLLPYVRQGVVRRECTKSLLVRVHHQFRLAFRQLAELMVGEGRLPEKDLIFFMTLYEIQTLLDTRSPAIIIKASRRRRLMPKLNKLRFPEVMFGVPRPLSARRPAPAPAGLLVVTGTPVCQGRVEGTARVVTSVAEAGQIQRDDILITHATDIGWSPYFPVLGGVVTELGGLISHGAVVAREYGLPCVVGATGASDVFQSGDTVVLDGTLGTITRVSPAQTPATPAQTPATPAQTPAAQAQTPANPAQTPATQAQTPAAPVQTPAAQAQTPAAQVQAPATPAQTPATPAQTPATPAQTTATPAQTPATPVKTPATPVQTPATPVQTPATPVQTPATPVQTPATPVQTPATPVKTPATQVQTPATPVQTPATQVQTPATPVQTPATPVQTPATPVQTPATPAQIPTTPAQAPAIPVRTPIAQAQTPATPVKTLASPTQTPGTPAQTPTTQVKTPDTPAQTPATPSQ